LHDVVNGSKEFKAILVYDVSRWGRFQDTDEAAHYEFLCRKSGIPVHYCAEQFTNDLALPSVILKSLKRMMAAEYSRELSARTYVGLRRAAQEGFRLGSTPGYGFRRMLFSADGNPKQILRDGEEKSLATDRVRLVLGPPEEVKVVRLIYRMLRKDMSRPSAIMRELSQRGITFYGRPWTFYGVKHVLTHPKYCGLQVWGRTETKLKTPPKRVAEEDWITAVARGPQIVDERTFTRAQQVYRDRTDHKTDEQLLEALRVLWRKKGYLTEYMIDASRITPSVNTYRRRFGRLSRAFQLIQYRQPKSRILEKRTKSRRGSSRLRRRLIGLLQSMFPSLVTPGDYEGYIHCPEPGIDVAVLVCRATKVRRQTEWSVSPRRNETVSLLCLLNESNDCFQSYYVFPRLRVSHGFRIYRNSELLSQGKKLHSLREFYRAVIDAHRQLSPSDQIHEPEVLIGVPQIGRYLAQSAGIVRRLIREGMPATRQGRCLTAIPEQITEWVRRYGTAWKPTRDRFGRYLPGGVQAPISRAVGNQSQPIATCGLVVAICNLLQSRS
jgi:DNA invertase Pin-like site-specific DNA recombinase